jgi:hypothetical protein
MLAMLLGVFVGGMADVCLIVGDAAKRLDRTCHHRVNAVVVARNWTVPGPHVYGRCLVALAYDDSWGMRHELDRELPCVAPEAHAVVPGCYNHRLAGDDLLSGFCGRRKQSGVNIFECAYQVCSCATILSWDQSQPWIPSGMNLS